VNAESGRYHPQAFEAYAWTVFGKAKPAAISQTNSGDFDELAAAKVAVLTRR
jgi:hypothetical protein